MKAGIQKQLSSESRKKEFGKMIDEIRKVLLKYSGSAMVYFPNFGTTTLVMDDASKFALLRHARLEEKVLEKLETDFIEGLKINEDKSHNLNYMG